MHISQKMRKSYLDYLRAFAIIGVVFTHVTVRYYNNPLLYDTATWWMANVLNAASRLAVPLFVMISGAVLLGKSQSINEFYRKRSIRILPPWIFWSIIFLIFNYWLTRDLYTLLWFFKGGLFIQGNTTVHLWYLSMFACLMLFAPFINKLILRETFNTSDIKILTWLILVFVIMAECAYIYQIAKGKPIQWFRIFVWYIPYFIGGYLIDRYIGLIKISSKTIITFGLASLVVGIFINYIIAARLEILKDSMVLRNEGLLVYILAFSTFTLARRHMEGIKENMFISSMAVNSFGIYLLHPLIIYFFHTEVIQRYTVNGLIAIPLTVAVTLALSWVIVSLMRRNQWLRIVT